MSDTPKKSKCRTRTSLSLTKRFNKRPSSPKDSILSADAETDVQKSPNVEFTTPLKKPNLDESCDDSPSSFDESFSPSAFLSQTYGSESPEVGWRWTKDDNESKTDSGFYSNKISSTNDLKSTRNRGESSREAYLNKRDERRRAKEKKLRKAEKARIEELLRERVAKLESQFRDTTQKGMIQQPQENTVNQMEESPTRCDNVFGDIDDMFNESKDDFHETRQVDSRDPAKAEHVFHNVEDMFDDSNIDFGGPDNSTIKKTDNPFGPVDDFFNDSDTDCMLVAATQQLESVIPELTQPTILTQSVNQSSNRNEKEATVSSKPKDERSLHYMQFFEDDEDDFFVSLDDSWLQKATQSGKPRSPFQRYRSMPTATNSTTKVIASPDFDFKNDARNTNNTANTLHTSKSIKRHASSHTMTPSSSRYRGRHLPSRD